MAGYHNTAGIRLYFVLYSICIHSVLNNQKKSARRSAVRKSATQAHALSPPRPPRPRRPRMLPGGGPARARDGLMAQKTRVQHLLGDDDDAKHRPNVQNTEVSNTLNFIN